MAWTDPRTWTTNELVTAAMMNTHIRDDLNALAYHLVARKTSDESDATGVVQNDDTLLMAIAANEVWQYKFSLRVVSASTTDIQIRLTFPTSGDLAGEVIGGSGSVIEGANIGSTTSPSPIAAVSCTSSITNYITLEGVYVNAGNSGNLQLQWSGNAAATCTVKANSTLWAVKLA